MKDARCGNFSPESPGASSARLFVGIEVSEEARVECARFASLAAERLSGRLGDAGLYHVTLCFLGQTPRRALGALQSILRGAAGESFAAQLSAPGCFKGGSILWVGLKKSAPLLALQKRLAAALREGGFPVAEEGEYVAHITLGRQLKGVGALLSGLTPDAIRPISFPVDHIVLFESARINGVLRYVPLLRVPMEAPHA